MIELYNSLTRKKEIFKPLEKGIVKIYSCGPTVYSRQHIGNMRAAICWDVLKRAFRYFEYEVIDVVNITDVGHLASDEDFGEDKMLKAAKKENKNPYEIAKFYENLYVDDFTKLNIIIPKYLPRATEHITEQLKIIEDLEKKKYTYVTSDGVYFDVSKFSDYGKLSGQSLEDKKAGARVVTNSEKKNPFDFALWKFLTGDNVNHIMKWDSKWGVGFPGWHLECSAMSSKYLGDKIDIHTGGIEHIPVHHENEIAQNVCSGVVKKVNYWLHNAHLLVDGEKMAKSLGNVYNIDTLIEKGYEPFTFRESCLRTHYRKSMNFTFQSLEVGVVNVKKINDFFSKLKILKESSKENHVENFYNKYLDMFENAIKDDLNTSVALAAIYEFIHEFNKLIELSKKDILLAIKFMRKTDQIIGLIKEEEEVPLEVIDFARERKIARENKDFEKSDKLRDEIHELGYEIKDSNEAKEGFILSRI